MQEQLCPIKEAPSNLVKLRELTNKLPTFGDLVKIRAPRFVEMETIAGHSLGISL